MVFDDAVVDDGESPLAIEMRVGVGLGHAAVGRPPGVPQGRVAARQLRRGLADLADVLFDQQPSWGSPVLVAGDPPRVVAAILELLQPGQHQLGGFVAATDVAEYAAHGDHALLSGKATFNAQADAVGRQSVRRMGHSTTDTRWVGFVAQLPASVCPAHDDRASRGSPAESFEIPFLVTLTARRRTGPGAQSIVGP